MEVQILGPLLIVAEGRRPVGGTKVRGTMALLALRVGTIVSYQELVDELWGDRPPGNTRNALQANIARLRRLLECAGAGETLQTVGQGYRLDLHRDAVDADRFRRLSASGTRCLAEQPGRAVELLEQALRIWRGPALIDAGAGAHCRAAARWLNDSRLATQEDLLAARLALGDERAVAPELETLLVQHPLRERLYDLLMLALYRSDRQADAVAVFHLLRRRLSDDLGLQPGHTVQRRYRAILDHDPALTAPRVAV
jgi:DNA-binding SARP family transcriptional activator